MHGLLNSELGLPSCLPVGYSDPTRVVFEGVLLCLDGFEALPTVCESDENEQMLKRREPRQMYKKRASPRWSSLSN